MVLVGRGDDAIVARFVALAVPEHVRGLVLIGEPRQLGPTANADIPLAPALAITGASVAELAASNLAQAREDWGSRLSSASIANLATAWNVQSTAIAESIVTWIAGPAVAPRSVATSAEQPRIAPPLASTLSAEQRLLSQRMQDSLNTPDGRRLGVLGPRAVLLHDPKTLTGYLGIGDAMASAPVPLRCKELAILVTARATDSDYEWAAHERAALAAGVPVDVAGAIKLGRTPTFKAAADRIVYEYTTELHRDHYVSDTTYQAAWNLLGTNGLINLTLVIGHYVNVAYTVNAHRIELPAGSTPLPPRQP
jgi:4-carboxymuconolactone decarboxylase